MGLLFSQTNTRALVQDDFTLDFVVREVAVFIELLFFDNCLQDANNFFASSARIISPAICIGHVRKKMVFVVWSDEPLFRALETLII